MMRRVLASLLAAGLLAAAATAPAAAEEPVSITIQSADLVAGGVAVNVTFDVVCQPIGDNPNLNVEYGWASVDQAVSKKAIARGKSDFYGDIVCDGSTVNSYTRMVRPESVPFRKGVAFVEAYAYIMDYDNWEAPGERGSSAVEMMLRK